MSDAATRFQKPTYSGPCGDAASGELDELLSKVLPLQQSDEALRRVLDAIDHRLAIPELAGDHQVEQRLVRLGVTLEPVEHDHALHLDAVHQDRTGVLQAVRLGLIEGGNSPADHDA